MDRVTLNEIQRKMEGQVEAAHGKLHLLCEFDLSEEEIEAIRWSYERILYRIIPENRHSLDLPACYYLMDVGMRNYDEGNYWSALDVPMDANEQRVVGKFFKETMQRYGLAFDETAGRINVSNFLMHALIPERYAEEFYNLIHRYYRVMLNGEVPDDILEKLKIIAEIFSDEKVGEKYPELSNMKLIKSTRRALGRVDYFGPTVVKILKRLSNDCDLTSEDLSLGIFESSFREWSNNLNSDRKKRASSQYNASPYIRYDLESGVLYLEIPDRADDAWMRRLEVVSGDGKILTEHSINTYEQFRKFVMDSLSVPLKWDPLDCFKVLIDGRRIFSNENPGHVILNKKGEGRTKVSPGFNMAIVRRGTPISLESSEVGSFKGFEIRGFMIMPGQEVVIGGRRYPVESEVSQSVRVLSSGVEMGCRDSDGNEYPVYRSHPVLRVERGEGDKRLNLSVRHGLFRATYRTIGELSDDPACTRKGSDLELDISRTGVGDRDGIYTIRALGKSFNYVLLKDAEFTFEEGLYTEDKESSLSCPLFPEPVRFRTTQGTVDFPPLRMDGRELHLSAEVPSRRYSFDRANWAIFDSKEIYYRDLTSEWIFIHCPDLVFPRITVDYKGSKPLDLEMDNANMLCGMRRIQQIGRIREYTERMIPALDFSCGGFKLFRIRYTADYKKEGRRIVRSNAPSNTYAMVSMDDGSGMPVVVPFSADTFLIDYGFKGDILVTEYYDSGFGEEESILAFKAKI